MKRHPVVFLATLLVAMSALIAPRIHAGDLKDLVQRAKDEAKGRAEQKAGEVTEQAEQTAGTDSTPPAEVNAGDAAPGAVASTPQPLPPASVFSLELRTADPKGDNPTDPAVAFPTGTGLLYARLLEDKQTGRAWWIRIVADDVPGLPRGLMVCSTPFATSCSFDEGMNKGVLDMPLPLPRILRPGRYSAKVVEESEPFRVAASFPLTITAAASEKPEAFNLTDPENGGLLESATGEGGAGITWSPRLLVPGNDREWQPWTGSDDNSVSIPMPWELVVSFFDHETALVSQVAVTSSASDNAPKIVEVWGSSQSATEGFAQLATHTRDESQAEILIDIPPTAAKFIKIRLLAKPDDDTTVRITGVRVIEGSAPGYTPLGQRRPELADWKIQPRHAAQTGLYFLQASAAEFQHSQNCIGCHVQSQALMGVSIAAKNGYVLSQTARDYLVDYVGRSQYDTGDFARNPDKGANDTGDATNSVLCSLGLSYVDPAVRNGKALALAARWIAAHQQDDGSVPTSDERPPVTQGTLFQTSCALDVWDAVLKQGDDPALRQAMTRGLTFIANAETGTTQDEVFKLLALVRHGNDAQKKTAHQVGALLLQQQQSDGGWTSAPDDTTPSNSFSTGEALYALRVAGTAVGLPAFQRGVRWLIAEQRPDWSWPQVPCATPFAATMWPVIALVGSFTTKDEPARIVVTALPRPPAPLPAPAVVAPAATAASSVPPNIELILDCSGSMDTDLGGISRLATAKATLRTLVAKLPDGANVGLRLYGHRYSSFSSKSRTDTELVVPIGPIDRPAMLKAIDAAKTHGETPLVYSTLQAGDDLKKIGGGSIVVVTDGEESCGGKPREAGPKLATLGVPIRLDVIGFTLTGRHVIADMAAFTQPTGGRFYTAADGVQLAKALVAATSFAPRPPPPPLPPPTPAEIAPEDFPYEVFNATHAKVGAGTTLSPEGPELEPGVYSVVLHDGAKAVTLDAVKLTPAQTVQLQYAPADGKLHTVSADAGEGTPGK